MYADTAHGANPVDASLYACQATCCLRFGEVAILPFVILHPRLGDEQLPIRQRAHDIGQVVMGFAFKDVADGKRRVLGDGQSVGGGKLGTNITTSIADHLRMILQGKKESCL